MRQHAAPGSDRARRSFSWVDFGNGRGDADVQGRENGRRRRGPPAGGAPLRRKDENGNRLPVARGARTRALPDARLRRRAHAEVRRALWQPQRLETRVPQCPRAAPTARPARLHPGDGSERCPVRGDGAFRTLFGCPELRTLFGCRGLFSPIRNWRLPTGGVRAVPQDLFPRPCAEGPRRRTGTGVSRGPSGQARGSRGKRPRPQSRFREPAPAIPFDSSG